MTIDTGDRDTGARSYDQFGCSEGARGATGGDLGYNYGGRG